MARRRMIDPNFWGSEDIAKLSILARLLFVGMISNADDEGRGRANTNYLKSVVFPYDEIPNSKIDKALDEIALNTSVIFYGNERGNYYEFVNWDCWQRVDHPTQSILPQFENDSGMVRERLSPNIKEDKLKEKKRNICAGVGGFEDFWKAYPRKVAKVKAQEKWNTKVKEGDQPLILAAIEKLKKTDDWKRENGQFIPHPTTWLNQERWRDEPDGGKYGEFKFHNDLPL